MIRKRFTALVSLLLVTLIVLAACGPRAGGAEMGQVADDTYISVPALVIDFDSEGEPSIGGLPTADLGSLVNQDLSAMSIGPEAAQAMVNNQIQHIQIDNTPDGLLILVNGKPIPSLGWDGESLVATAEVMEEFGADVAPLLDKLLPLIRNIGLAAIIRFPAAPDAEIIAYVVTDDQPAETSMTQQIVNNVVAALPAFDLVISYADDGSWSVAGIGEEEWAQYAPMVGGILDGLAGSVKPVSAAGVAEVSLATNENGVFVSLNGKLLPHITWEDGRVSNVLDLAAQSGLLDSVIGDDPATQEMVLGMVYGLLPAVQQLELSLTLQFPAQ